MQKTVTVQLQEGMDPSVVAHIVQAACKYDSRVYLKKQERKVNAKSIMGMMNIVVAHGNEVTIIAEGSDEQAAVEEIEKLLGA